VVVVLIGSPVSQVHMYFRRRVCITALWLVTLLSALAFGQGTKIHSEYEPIQDHERDQPKQREQWFMRGRTVPGQSAAALRYRAHLQKMQLRAAPAERARMDALAQGSAINVWAPLGPAPVASDATGFGGQDYSWVSGRATAVAVDPADSSGNTVYVGGAYGGVWKSTDAGPVSPSPSGVTWVPVIDNQPTLAVGAIAIQPGNTNPANSVILVGTGETNSSADSYYGLGILRSTDGGNTWALISQDSTGTRSFAGLGFSKIAFRTSNPSLVVAAAAAAAQGSIEGLENPVTVNRGLYYSINAGVSWTYASVKDVSATIDPGSATSVVYNPAARTFFAAMRYHGIYSSADGINWTRLATQPGTGLSSFACPAHTASPSSCPIYRGEFAVVPGRNEMYVWYLDASDNDQGIWQTMDGGSTWTQLSDTGITNCGDSLGGCGTSQGSYNLELAAVPNGTATDLYAGAINIYKCTITSLSPSCSGTGSNTFLNLTHAYGCPPDFGSIARVHPDQHGLDFTVANGKAILYFANDGGIYRALDGYTGLTTGTCGGSNQFDSLNQTLGSMTQFVSFSQHPTDPNTLLGGTQDNGSPATASSQMSASWLNVNEGDGGYNAINPNNPTEWFTANTNVSIQRCTLGISCHAQDFSNDVVVSNATLGGDSGAFYTPYILDPQNFGELLVGTCRLWRGATIGTGFAVLTSNFETGSAATCTGSEINLVRSLAAGGIKDSLGFSNVIYAGTDGLGPSVPTGGHVWVTTNASGGAGTWFDRTATINPGGFPISDVAIDASDATGKTAYLTIMGFHVSHVWKTSNAGVNWTDFTANLPDAPANAILVDKGASPTTGTVYVATDVGVFSSSTASANWTEVGPAPSNGQAGYLPNVSVTALRMFNSAGTKKLRASTYGRGVWEFTLISAPDFEFGASDTPSTVFPGQTAVFNGTLQALDGYTSLVNLSCVNGPTPKPATCSVTPSSLTPTSSGAPFTVNASGPVADYLFDVHGVGTDLNTITHNSSLMLHVVDFNLTTLAPASLTVNTSSSSAPVSFQVTAAGSFNAAVTLSCTGLPAGAACNFQPSNSVNPTSAIPVAVTLTISTSTNTPAGTFSITINGSATGGPTRTQNLSLTVTTTSGSGDYTLAISNPSQTVPVTGSATFNGTLTSSGGYSSVVNLSCGVGRPLTCVPSPASLTPTVGGAAFTVTAGSNVVQNYSFSIVATGTDTARITHSAAVALNVTFDFAVNNNSGAQTVVAGQSASYNLDVRPLGNGSTFPNSAALSCSGLPALSTCSFMPNQVAAGSGDTNLVLTITTTAPIPPSAGIAGAPVYALWLPLPGLVLAFCGLRDRAVCRKRFASCLTLTLLALLLCLGIACGNALRGGGGGAGQPGTPPNNYTITVNAAMNTASGPLSHSAQVTLTVQ